MIGESSYQTKAKMLEITSLKKFGKGISGSDNTEYSQVTSELEYAKRELFKLKLDVASVLEEKARAEKQIEASKSNVISCSRVAQTLRKEIEEDNEEQVVVELARMEALKEMEDIESRKENETNELAFKLETTRNKLKEAIKEIDESKEVEMKLAMTVSQIDILKNELKLVKKMEKRVERDESMEHVGRKKSRDCSALQAIKEETEAAKKELALVREEGFKLMASMDSIRNEMKQVNATTVHLKNAEAKTGFKIRNLSSKLLRAKAKLETISAAEEKAKSVVINLSQTLDKMESEGEAAKKEKELVNEEVSATEEEIKKALFEIDMSEETLQGAMQELEAVKLSEALALKRLKSLTENAMRERSLETQPSSSITISKFEYEYLTNHATEAKAVADKKVEAANAWVEAAKGSEKEMVMKTKIAEAKLKEYKKEMSKSKRVNTNNNNSGSSNEELENWRRKREKIVLRREMSRKSIKSDGSMTPSRGSKFLKSASPAPRPVSPFIVKKKKKVITNLAKFFKGKKNNTL
ncbi:hypothetical protein RJT34_27697 [Clitoria ternatea]|uniref:Protein PLASTID MOVEMENT IMPAIRED 2 n=1 Tax=Clitoria ternatea TaxID=43366 RepID=A0AAN9F8G1_CLITE